MVQIKNKHLLVNFENLSHANKAAKIVLEMNDCLYVFPNRKGPKTGFLKIDRQ